jgi:hypothetical protein
MLEYVKTILHKVSFDPFLFERELRKSVEQLVHAEELADFRNWCYNHFGDLYSPILNQVFS